MDTIRVSFFVLFLLFSIVSALDRCDIDKRVVVTEHSFGSEAQDIIWLSPHDTNDIDAIFVRTNSFLLYRSLDDGKQFIKQSIEGIEKIVTTADTKKLWFVAHDKLWITKDQGGSYEKRQLSGIISIEAHPTESEWAAAIVASEGCSSPSKSGSCSHDLHITKDMGLTWTQIKTYVQQVSWGNAGKGVTPKENLFVIGWDVPLHDKNRWDLKSYDLQFTRSRDLFTTTSFTKDHCVALLFAYDTLFFAYRESSGVNSPLQLWVSIDGGESFGQAQFPTDEYIEMRYSIADVSEEAAFINVDHSSDSWGNLYGSGSLDTDFNLVLPYNKRKPTGEVDLRPVKGLEAIYLANQLIDPDNDLGDTTRGRSLISFDKCGSWDVLPAPKVDSNGFPIPPCDNCSLHIFGPTQSDKSQFYSNENAVGLILATGHVGPYLQNNKDEVNTYFSRDGGVSWEEISKGDYLFKYADHGAIVLMAQNDETTRTLKYSWNEGIDWVECIFADEEVDVIEIFVEPTSTAKSFLLKGEVINGGIPESILYHVDFTMYHERECSDRDYEDWSPADSLGHCLNGEKRIYTRRKRDAACFNNLDLDHEKLAQACTCTRNDYECDFCFHDAKDGECKFYCTDHASVSQPEPCEGTWMKSQGYRKTAGNKCTDSDETARNYGRVETKCEHTVADGNTGSGDGSNGVGGGTIFGIIVLLLAFFTGILLVGGIVAGRMNPQIREMYDQYLPAVLSPVWTPAAKSTRRSPATYNILGQTGGSLLDDLEDGDDDELNDDAEEIDVNKDEGSDDSTKGNNNSDAGEDDDEFNPRG